MYIPSSLGGWAILRDVLGLCLERLFFEEMEKEGDRLEELMFF